jgi:IS5 family transposase
MKAHISVDVDSGLVHAVVGTTAKTADCSVLEDGAGLACLDSESGKISDGHW